MELDPAVDVPVEVHTEWSSPDGAALVFGTQRPMMKSFSRYTSKAVLSYVEPEDSGEYTCTVTIENGTKLSMTKVIQIGKTASH